MSLRNAVRIMLAACVPAMFVNCSCGSDSPQSPSAPDTIELASTDAHVTLTFTPTFAMRIAKPDGTVVLDTFNGDRKIAGDDLGAYGALGATHRDSALGPSLLEGYDHVVATDEPWLHGTHAVSATATDTSATVTLADDKEPNATVTVIVTLKGADVEVDATITHDRTDTAHALNMLGQSFASSKDEHFVGLGEREATVDHRGRHYQCWTEEGGIGGGESAPPSPTNPAPNGPGMTHVPIPFFISSHGYGLWIDSSFRTGFALDSDDDNVFRVYAAQPRLHYHVFVADAPSAAIAAFTDHVGRAPLPAPWVFGPRRRMDTNKTITLPDGTQVLEADAMRSQGVPTTVADDTTHFLPNAGAAGREDELRAWTANLHRLGYKAVGYFNGHVSATIPDAAALLADGRAKDVFVRLDDGSEFQTFMISGGDQQVVTLDFTKPQAVTWFEDRMGEALGLDYDGWMLDFGEYLPPHALLNNGMSGYEAHNLYPLMLQKAAADYLRRTRGTDYLFFSRSGYAGSQTLTPVLWSGDPSASFDNARGLPAQVRMAVNAGLSGIPFWGSDISGFTCLNDAPPDKDVYLRWAAFGALSSDMHDENACAGAKPGAPPKWTLWSDAETTAVYGKYAQLHTRLFPYLYATAQAATQTGLPVMRAPLLMNPEAPDAWTVTEEYWFGPALYVAPVVRRAATTRELWLPPGTWFDWWTYTATAGNARIARAVPIDVIPLYLRAGRIVAMLSPDVQTLASTDDPSVVDMSDRDGLLDVRVGLTADDATAATTLVDGTTLQATRTSTTVVFPNDVTSVPDEASLATCSRCGRIDGLPDGTTRVRISATGNVNAGGLTLDSARPDKAVRVRWDVLVR